MSKKLLFGFILLFVGVEVISPPTSFGYQQSEKISEITYDENLGAFTGVPETRAGVDSLLAIGNEMRERDSRMSFSAGVEALAIAEKLGYREGEAEAHNLVGNKYLDFGDYEHALEHYLIGLEIETELGNKDGMAGITNNKALVHLEQEQYNRAADYLEESIEIRREMGEYEQAYISINNLGVIKRRSGNYDSALKYFHEAKNLSLEVAQDSVIHTIALLNIGNTHRNRGEMDKALDYLQQADGYFEREGYTVHQITANLFTGQLYDDLGDYDRALEYGFRSLELAKRENNRERISDAHELIAGIYKALEDYESALNHFELYKQMSDTLSNLQRANQLNEMQVQFDVEQRDQQIALNEARISEQETLRNFMFTVLGLLVLLSGILYFGFRQKKKANRLLDEKNVELAELNSDKDDFISVAAHDLRNPLSVILTATTLLKSEKEPNRENIEEYSELIQISTDRMLNLVNNMLDIQSVENGGVELQLEELDVNDLIQKSIKHFEKTAEVKMIELIPQLENDEVPITCDSSTMIRVFDNILSNAIKYSPPKSKVWIRSKKMGDTVRISIKDEGPGLTDEDQQKLFKRFSSLSSSPTGNETSTGLGLYIVKKLVTSMGGEVSCESTYGEGAEFNVEFPAAGDGIQEGEIIEKSSSSMG